MACSHDFQVWPLPGLVQNVGDSSIMKEIRTDMWEMSEAKTECKRMKRKKKE